MSHRGWYTYDAASTHRRGFTLVELLVVIVIIGILIGLLLPVLGIARASVQEAAMTTEVANLDQALRSFATQNQTEYPPDFSGPNKKAEIDQFLSRMFRYRNPATDVPRTAATGPQPQLINSLDPSEALYFWLRGFSSDPANPLFGPLNQSIEQVDQDRTPLFEFDRQRLRDVDGDGFLEYYPKYAVDQPYTYYANYSYLRAFNTAPTDIALRLGPVANAAIPAPRPYLSTVTAPAIPTGNQIAMFSKEHFAAPDSFQILCAGLDNDFGSPITINGRYAAYAYPEGPYPEKAHKDNITNFAQGTLEDQMP